MKHFSTGLGDELNSKPGQGLGVEGLEQAGFSCGVRAVSSLIRPLNSKFATCTRFRVKGLGVRVPQ